MWKEKKQIVFIKSLYSFLYFLTAKLGHCFYRFFFFFYKVETIIIYEIILDSFSQKTQCNQVLITPDNSHIYFAEKTKVNGGMTWSVSG